MLRKQSYKKLLSVILSMTFVFAGIPGIQASTRDHSPTMDLKDINPEILSGVVTSSNALSNSESQRDKDGKIQPSAKLILNLTAIPEVPHIPGFDQAFKKLKEKATPVDKKAKGKRLEVSHFNIDKADLPELIKQLKGEYKLNQSKVDFNIVLTKKEAYSDSYLTDIAGEFVNHHSDIHKKVMSQNLLKSLYEQHESNVKKSLAVRALNPNPITRRITKNGEVAYDVASRSNRITLTVSRLVITTGLSTFAFVANNALPGAAFVMGFIIGCLSASLTWYTEPYLKFLSHKVKFRLSNKGHTHKKSHIYLSEEKAGLGYGLSMFGLTEVFFLTTTKAIGAVAGSVSKFIAPAAAPLKDLALSLNILDTSVWAIPIQAPSELTNSVLNNKKYAKYFESLMALGAPKDVRQLKKALQEIEELRINNVLSLKSYKKILKSYKKEHRKLKTSQSNDNVEQAKAELHRANLANRKVNVLIDFHLRKAWSGYFVTLQEKVDNKTFTPLRQNEIVNNFRSIYTNSHRSALNALVISAVSNTMAMYIFGGAGEPIEAVNALFSQINFDYVFKTGHAIALAFGVTTSAIYLQVKYGTFDKIYAYAKDWKQHLSKASKFAFDGAKARRTILLSNANVKVSSGYNTMYRAKTIPRCVSFFAQ